MDIFDKLAGGEETGSGDVFDRVAAIRPRAADAKIPETRPNPLGWDSHPVTQALIGAGKHALQTAANLAPKVIPGGGLTKRLIKKASGVDLDTFFDNPDIQAGLAAENTPQKVGQLAATAGEFMLGEGLAARGATAIAPRLASMPTTLRSLAGAASGAGVTAAQGGETEEVVTNAAIGGVAPWAFSALGKGMRALGQKVQTTVIRPSDLDWQDGFKLETLEKYGLGGSLDASARKTAQAIQARAQALQAELAAAGGAGAQVDLSAALAAAEAELKATPGALFGRRAGVDNAIAQFQNEIAAFAPMGTTDILTAQQVKRATGNLGAWQYGARDPESSALELVANAFYSKMRQAIEAASGTPRIAQINAELGELIPVENAIIRRIPVEARGNVLNISKIIAIAHGHAPLLGAEMALKSGTVGAGLVAGGRGLAGGAPKLTALAQAGVMTADPFGHREASRQARAEVQQQAGGDHDVATQIMGGKRQVYINPDGSQISVPASVALAFSREGDEGNSPIGKWLAAMKRQKKIKDGGRLAFVDAAPLTSKQREPG